MSLATLAAHVGGVKVPHLCEIELGRKSPSVRLARAISAATGLTLEDVVGQR